ncbi:MAG: ABC transporter permease [Bacilli bacterium]
MKKTKDFEIIEKDPDILEAENKETYSATNEDFKLVNRDDYAQDQKFETKPTTFLKDSLKRFSKNKSSVVAAWILGGLLLLAFVVPIVDTSVVSKPNSYEVYLQPKLFDAGTGFWDGTKKYTNIAYDVINGCPDSNDFVSNAVSDLVIDSTPSLTNSYSAFATGGYVQFSALKTNSYDSLYLETVPMVESQPLQTTVSNTISFSFGDEEIEYYKLAPYRIDIIYTTYELVEGVLHTNINTLTLKDYSKDYSDYTLDVSALLNAANPGQSYYYDAHFQIVMDCTKSDLPEEERDAWNNCILIKSVVFETDSTSENYVTAFTAPSFTDANEMIGRTKESADQLTVYANYWSTNGNKYLYHASMYACSFTYDTYQAAFGEQAQTIDNIKMNEYIRSGWCNYDYDIGPSSFEKLSEKCPVVSVSRQETSHAGSIVSETLYCSVIMYRYRGYSSMPRYLLGTDKSGRDMLKYTFEGLRTSLLLGIITSAICFIFGLCWGAISGYFGGNIDLAMERFTDILGGLPWIVVMTLCIIHLGQSFGVFALALCLTGWIGTSSLTRTQFYRFKGREYVLASRTLGASDIRLIFKHILPNAMGTIITSAVLMIPGVIFSEATISYLGLGLQGMSSLGVILSSNQAELLQHAHLLIFPSVIIALLEICFNLFGNGLRDAINPTLKGEDGE